MVVPVGRHAGSQQITRKIVPEASKAVFGLREPEQVLGHGDLGDSMGDGMLAVGSYLLDGGDGITLLMRPEVEVVVEHAGRGPFEMPLYVCSSADVGRW
jgi:hypothetical protein